MGKFNTMNWDRIDKMGIEIIANLNNIQYE